MTLKFEDYKHLNYKEFCKLGQKVNGMPKVPYGVNGYVKNGFECHHIAESLESNLSNTEKIKQYPQYQTPDQLVYFNHEQHLWAHLLINSEVLLKDTTSERCEDLSIGGIHNILTYHLNEMNKKTVGKMLAEHCNKISSQMSLDTANSQEALDKLVARTGLKDATVIKEATKRLKTNICLDHNRQAYIDTEAILLSNPSVIACICTCGGKTPFGLEFMNQHRIRGKKFLVVVPKVQIYDQWDKEIAENDLKNNTSYRQLFDVVSIQTLSGDNKWLTYELNKYCGIIIDEVHHINENAKVWIQPIKYFVEKGIKVLGLTATTTNSQTKEEDAIFSGRIIEGLDIVEGIENNILWPYHYISSLYSDSAATLPQEYNLLNDQLDLFLKDHKVSDTIIKYEKQLEREGQKKGIIFVAGTRNIPEEERANKLAQFDRAIELVKEAYPNAKFYKLSSRQTNKENCDAKNAFKANKTDDCFLVSFGMVNEGAHYEGVNTLIMFRTTHSEIVFTQQLGRIMRLKCRCPENPNLTVFDFTNNALTLLDEADKDHETIDYPEHNRKEKARRPEEYLQGKDVIVACEAGDIIQYLLTLRAIKDQKKENDLFKKTLDDIQINDVSIDEAFADDVYENWKDIEVVSKGTTIIRRNENATTKEVETVANIENVSHEVEADTTKEQKKGANKSAETFSKKIKMTKIELFIYLSKLTFDRAAVINAIDLCDGKLEVASAEQLEKLCKLISLKKESFLKLLFAEKLSRYWDLEFRKIWKQLIEE